MPLRIPRFDYRSPPKGDDGDDFQSFVSEVLHSRAFDNRLVPKYIRAHFAPGRDGAIDITAHDDGGRVVFECKFFGEGRTGSPQDDWVSVARTLAHNLRRQASKPRDQIADIYLPWFDLESPVLGYWFCTSGYLSEGANDALRKKIKDFFRSLGEELPTLAHLITVDVVVLDWSAFEGALVGNRSLAFRWFAGLPLGISLLKKGVSRAFHRFLDSDSLPYFSRREFDATQSAPHALPDENKVLEQLLGDDICSLVIAGPGGVGKTRLALELARRATEKGYVALHAHNLHVEAVADLARRFGSSARIVLILDYAESLLGLTEFVEEVERVNRDGGHAVRVIATCRTSGSAMVREALTVPHIFLNLVSLNDHAYAKWVVGKILTFGGITNAELIQSVCGGLPVLAAFAVFLFQQDRAHFESQFSDLSREDDFIVWANKRLRIAESTTGLSGAFVRRHLASLMATLPLSQRAYEHRRTEGQIAALIDVLGDDHWIERIDGQWISAHDVFADAIIARYALENSSSATARVGDVLSDAMHVGALSPAIIAVDRLAGHAGFASVDGLVVLERLHDENAEKWLEAGTSILRSRLIDERAKLKLFKLYPELGTAAKSDQRYDFPVSMLAEHAVLSGDLELREDATPF